jgi:uncharacterized membrane protein
MAGMRTWSPVAFVGGRISHDVGGGAHLLGWPFSLLASRSFSGGATLVAAVEIVADKLPLLPDRIDPIPLAGRVASGAFVGGAWGGYRGGGVAIGAGIGALAAAAATFAGFYLRRYAARGLKLPDPLAALAEDVAVIAIGAITTGEWEGGATERIL